MRLWPVIIATCIFGLTRLAASHTETSRDTSVRTIGALSALWSAGHKLAGWPMAMAELVPVFAFRAVAWHVQPPQYAVMSARLWGQVARVLEHPSLRVFAVGKAKSGHVTFGRSVSAAFRPHLAPTGALLTWLAEKGRVEQEACGVKSAKLANPHRFGIFATWSSSGAFLTTMAAEAADVRFSKSTPRLLPGSVAAVPPESCRPQRQPPLPSSQVPAVAGLNSSMSWPHGPEGFIVSLGAVSPDGPAYWSLSDSHALSSVAKAVLGAAVLENGGRFNTDSNPVDALPRGSSVSSLWAVCQAASQHRFVHTAFREWMAALRRSTVQLPHGAIARQLGHLSDQEVEGVVRAAECHGTERAWGEAPALPASNASGSAILLRAGSQFLTAEAAMYRRMVVARAVWDGKATGSPPEDTALDALLPWRLKGMTWASLAAGLAPEDGPDETPADEDDSGGSDRTPRRLLRADRDPLGWAEAAAQEAGKGIATLLQTLHLYCESRGNPRGLDFRRTLAPCQDLPVGWQQVAPFLATGATPSQVSGDLVAAMAVICKDRSAVALSSASLRAALYYVWQRQPSGQQLCFHAAEAAAGVTNSTDATLILLSITSALAAVAGIHWLFFLRD